MIVNELIEKLQALPPGLPVIAKEPELVFVDSHVKPGCWNENHNEVCRYLAVRLG